MSPTTADQAAFPTETGRGWHHGMTLRDYFAAKIMNRYSWNNGYENENAEACYKAADAMLKARGK